MSEDVCGARLEETEAVAGEEGTSPVATGVRCGRGWGGGESGTDASPDARPEPGSYVSAARLMELNLPAPEFTVHGIVPKGLCLLAGKPKLGKSWLALNVAIAVTSGGVALGQVKVDQGDVLYLALEDGLARLKTRLKKMLPNMGCDAPTGLEFRSQFPRADEGGLEEIEKWLKQHPNARMVVIDTWPRLRPRKAEGRNQYEEDYSDAADVKALADEYDVTFLLVCHCRKLDADDPVDSVTGTLGLGGSADGVLVLQRARCSSEATLFITGRDVEEERKLILRWDGASAMWSLAEDQVTAGASPARGKLISFLREKGPSSISDVAAGVGAGKNNVKQLLFKMYQEGQVMRCGPGMYYHPENPPAAA
jgi:hypothetical protein